MAAMLFSAFDNASRQDIAAMGRSYGLAYADMAFARPR
jgi:hypothetical protein